MKRMLLLVPMMLIAMYCAGCAGTAAPTVSPTINLSAEGRAAYHATRAVRALDLVRDIAIEAEAQTPKLMSTDSTRKVVRYHQATVKTIGALPNGWYAVALEGLQQLQKEIPAEEWRQIDPFVRLVLAVYQEVRP